MSSEEYYKQSLMWQAIAAKNVLNISEVALMMGTTKAKVEALRSEKAIPFYVKGDEIFFRKEEVERYLTKDRFESKEEIEHRAMDYCVKNPTHEVMRRKRK